MKTNQIKKTYPFRLPRDLILEPATVGADLVINACNCFPILKKRMGFCQGDDTDSATRNAIITL